LALLRRGKALGAVLLGFGPTQRELPKGIAGSVPGNPPSEDRDVPNDLFGKGK